MDKMVAQAYSHVSEWSPLTNLILLSGHLIIDILSYPVVLRAPSVSYSPVMADCSAPKNTQSNTGPPISDIPSILSCCVIGQGCQHEINPWSNADPRIQDLSTAALEALQEHFFAVKNSEPFAHMHEVARKEIARRKLNSRSANSNASTSSKQTTEVLFDVDDFGPPIVLLDDQETTPEVVCGRSQSECRDDIAKMSLAWVSGTRETARLRRTDGKRPTSVKHRGASEVAVVIDIEGRTEPSICFEDVEGLEFEMQIYT